MRRSTSLVLLLSVAFTGWACKELTHEERVAQARARYEVTLNGFFTQDPEPEEPMMEEGAAAAEGEAMAAAGAEAAAEEVEGEGEGEGEGEEGMEMPPRRVNVLLDLLVQHDLDDALPGITVDVIMVDPDKTEKGAWKVWVDTEGLPEANLKQVTHILEDVDYEEGDAFSAEIRSMVPEAEYGDYREFSAAGG